MDYLINIFTVTSYTIIAVMGVHIINGITGQLSLGHAGFWCLGAYITGIFAPLLKEWGVPSLMASPVLVILCISIIMIFAKIISIPLFKLKGDYFAVGTLCFSEIIRISIMNIDKLGGPRGLHQIPSFNSLPAILFYMLMTIIFCYRISNSKWGRSFRYIKDDEIASESVGLSLQKTKSSAFVISAVLVGISGLIFAGHQHTIRPDDFNLNISINFILMILVGGQGRFSGAILGAILLSVLPEGLRFLGSDVSSWRVSIFSVLLILLMLFRPQGIVVEKATSLKMGNNK